MPIKRYRSGLPGITPSRVTPDFTEGDDEAGAKRKRVDEEPPAVIPRLRLADDGFLLDQRLRAHHGVEDWSRGALAQFEVLRGLLEEPPLFYIVDERGVARNKPRLQIIRECAGAVPVWIDPGIRYADNIIDFIIAGAGAVVLNTETLRSLDELEEAVELSPNLIFVLAIEPRSGKICSPDRYIQGEDPRALLAEAQRVGVRRVALAVDDPSMGTGGPSALSAAVERTKPALDRLVSAAAALLRDDASPRVIATGPAAWAQRQWLWERGVESVVVDVELLLGG